MVFRDYHPGDFPQVETLWKETGIYSAERGDTAAIIERCNQNGGKFLVMVDPAFNQIIGTSWMTWDGRRLFLHHFAIHPLFQGQGHGRNLALQSLAFARHRKCPVKLEVHRDNTAAVNLYRSLGFKVFVDYEVYMHRNPGAPPAH